MTPDQTRRAVAERFVAMLDHEAGESFDLEKAAVYLSFVAVAFANELRGDREMPYVLLGYALGALHEGLRAAYEPRHGEPS
jgi:hypothetical protein